MIRKLLMTFDGKEETQLPLVDRTKCFVFDTPINLSMYLYKYAIIPIIQLF